MKNETEKAFYLFFWLDKFHFTARKTENNENTKALHWINEGFERIK